MKRVFSHPLIALALGILLRLFFLLKYPATSGDTVLYEELATNWLKHATYGMSVNGALLPVDVRMPGYPAFLALVYAISGHTGEWARVWVMLTQAAVDLLGCLFVAWLAAMLLMLADDTARVLPVLKAGLWLAALCPFTANYTAVLLTESLAIFFSVVSLVLLVGMAGTNWDFVYPTKRRAWEPDNKPWYWAISAGLAVGVATLFRPESPLLLLAGWVGIAGLLARHGKFVHWIKLILLTGAMCMVPLLPWAVRNAVTLHEVQFLTPKDAMLKTELVPRGFMAWEKTWLYRMRECYAVPWKLNEEEIKMEDIPSRAFDSEQEKRKVAEILEKYNEDLTLTADEDAVFGQLAKERTARHPLRTYLSIPFQRALTIWFTPRIELLPYSGNVFPLAQQREDDPVDQSVTSGLFLLNILYVALALWGGFRLWKWNPRVRPALLTIAAFILLRTAFLTTLEAPEPRYVLVCFPALLALGATLFGKPHKLVAP